MNQFPAAPPIPDSDDRSGYAHFVVVACRFEELDVLTLHASGHQRVLLSLKHDLAAWSIIALKETITHFHDQTRFALADRNWHGYRCYSRY